MLDRMRAGWISDGGGVASERRAFTSLSERFPQPDGVTERWIDLGGVPAIETVADDIDQTSSPALLYFHGGAFLIGSAEIYRYQSSKLARTTRARVYTVDYRLAPEHPFPAAIDDAVTAFDALLASGAESDSVVLAGDSAGGNIALATAMRLRDRAQPSPSGIVAISPWVDLTCSGESMESNANARHLAQRQGLLNSASTYLDGVIPDSPEASPLYGDLRALPPTLIQVGSLETLLDDSMALERSMREAGSEARLTIYSGMVHEWHLLSALLEPDERLDGAERAFEEIGAFVREVTSG